MVKYIQKTLEIHIKQKIVTLQVTAWEYFDFNTPITVMISYLNYPGL